MKTVNQLSSWTDIHLCTYRQPYVCIGCRLHGFTVEELHRCHLNNLKLQVQVWRCKISHNSYPTKPPRPPNAPDRGDGVAKSARGSVCGMTGTLFNCKYGIGVALDAASSRPVSAVVSSSSDIVVVGGSAATCECVPTYIHIVVCRVWQVAVCGASMRLLCDTLAAVDDCMPLCHASMMGRAITDAHSTYISTYI